MKEMMKQKMMNRFHKRNSSSSIDFGKSAEKLDFKFSSLQALQVPVGWDKLTLSLISVETDKTVTKTGKASVWNGNCRWTETLSETIWVDDPSKELPQYLYKLLISKASTRSGILGEVTVNLSNYLSSETSLPVAIPLKKCDHGTILQVAIQCLNPRANLRRRDTNSLSDVNSEYSDLDNVLDAPNGTSTNNIGSPTSNSILDTSHASGLGSRATSSSTVRSYHSFDSIEDSFGRESSSSNLSEIATDQIVKPELTGTVSVYDSPRSSRSPFSSGKNILNRRQDSGKVTHIVPASPIPASPLRTFGPSEYVFEAEVNTPEELRAEARTWERNARKLKVDLDLSRNETSNQTKNLENVTMKLAALQTECNGLKDEIKHLKILLGESEVKERDADNLKIQFRDKNDLQAELEEEIKFQKDLNNDLALQLDKTQESNLELVSVLQELEETIEKQKMEISNFSASEQPASESNDSWKLEIELQKFQEAQKHMEDTIRHLEKTLEEKIQTQLDNESEWTKKLSLKDKEILNLEAKLSKALDAPVPKETDFEAIETADLAEEVKVLKEKVQELERDSNELTDENLELLFRLKESEKDVSTSGTSSLGERPSTESKRIDDSDEITAPGYLQIRCNDLESKCTELEVQIQSFKDRDSYLYSEVERYKVKAGKQDNVIAELNQLLKCRLEEHHTNSFNQDKQASVDLENVVNSTTSQESLCVPEDNVQAKFSDLQIVNTQLEESLTSMQKEVNDIKKSRISENKILEKKLRELESHNQELELQLTELEEENLQLSGRISGLEPQLRYLTDARESSRLEFEHSESQVRKLQSEIERLENEVETTKVDMRQKVQDMQKRWLEAQEECEYLKKANPKLQSTTESLMEECSALQKSNSEVRNQRLELHNRCSVLETKLRESTDTYLKLSKNFDDLEDSLSSMLHGIESKEKLFGSELDGLVLQFKEHTEKCVRGESLLNQMYSEKVIEVENLKQEVEHLSLQISSTHDERDRMASEAVLEMHVLRADRDKMVNSIAELEDKLRLSQKKRETIQVEYDTRVLGLTTELSASKQNHEDLAANHEKLTDSLENRKLIEEKLKTTVGELAANLKSCEYEIVQLTEEKSSLEAKFNLIPELQAETVTLKNSLNDVKYENERLEASLQMISGDFQQLKEENASLQHKVSSMQKAVIELEDHRRTKIVLEEKVLRLEGDLTAREALGAQDAELKNELGRFKRSHSQLQWKINRLEEEKDEFTKKNQNEEQMKDLKPDEDELAENKNMKLTEDVKASTIDESSRIQSLEIALAEALEANEMYKVQLQSFLSEEQLRQSNIPPQLEVQDEATDKEHTKLEAELNELQERYLNMSLKYAEVEAQREELVLKLKAAGPGRSWFS